MGRLHFHGRSIGCRLLLIADQFQRPIPSGNELLVENTWGLGKMQAKTPNPPKAERRAYESFYKQRTPIHTYLHCARTL
jgi:hypothetical protein